MKKLTESMVCTVSFLSDLVLAIVKLFFGKTGNSSALLSDGVHSCADAFASLFVLFGALGKKNCRKKEKSEKITVRFICLLLFLTGTSMLISSFKSIVTGADTDVPSGITLFASLFSLIIKEALFFFSRYASKKTGSLILSAQAWHHQSDALSCVGSFIGISGAIIGIPVLDSVASLVISIMIIKTAFDIFRGKN